MGDLSQTSWVEIKLDNLENNFTILKEKAGDKKICCVVKASAYGHGAMSLVKYLDKLGADYFAVSSLQEALEIRDLTDKPIMTLSSPIRGSEGLFVENDVEASIFSLDAAKALNEAARAEGKLANIHIALDTGMNRIGYKPEDDYVREILKIKDLKNLHLKGAFTHFACADEAGSKTEDQFQTYRTMVNSLEKAGVDFDILHTDNDAAAMMDNHPGNMVRLGIGLYGVFPSAYVKENSSLDLRPIMAFKSRITNLKTLGPGEAISYGGTYVTDKKTQVATIGSGYADGISRRLSNSFSIKIKDRSCPILGNICMDQLMVDVTGLDLEIGDEVEIFGEKTSVDDLAEASGTISYEILSLITPRVERFYTYKGRVVEKRKYLGS